MKNKIKIFNIIYKDMFNKRKTNWEKFRTFHKEVIEIIEPELAEKLGSINNVCNLNKDYSLVFDAKDYAWWGSIGYKKCDIIDIEKLKSKLSKKLLDLLDKLDSSLINMETAEQIIEAFKTDK